MLFFSLLPTAKCIVSHLLHDMRKKLVPWETLGLLWLISHHRFHSTGVPEKRIRYHRRVCQDTAEFMCPEPGCDERFKSKVYIRNHMNRKHLKVACQHCGKEFSKALIRYHILQQHTAQADMEYQCGLCQKGFWDKKKYEDHMNTHTGERPHKCDYCANTFANGANKFKHIRESHQDEYQKRKAKRLAK